MSDLNNSAPQQQQPVENTAPTAAPQTAPQADVITQAPQSILDMIQDDTLKSEASLQSFKDITGLAKSYVNLNRMMGSSIRIPGPDASEEAKAEFYNKISQVGDVVKLPNPNNPEEVAAFYNKLGRPESPDQYDLKLPQDVPEELVDRGTLDFFRKQAFDLGLNSNQVNALVQFDLQRQMQQLDHMAKEKDQNSAILKKMWGADFEARSQAAQKMVEMYGQKFPEATKQLLSQHVTSPLVYQALAELGQIYQERGHMPSQSVKFGLTPDEARARIQEIRSNANHPVNQASHPNHDAALEELSNLYRLANPNQG